ncbi:MAG: hypothetical protein IKG47_10080, partial [Oscillospiraceae bacterium]|nr:hypothetical protein [Oscillospiraceae bacterium]
LIFWFLASLSMISVPNKKAHPKMSISVRSYVFSIHLRWIPPTSSFVGIIIHKQRPKSNELAV